MFNCGIYEIRNLVNDKVYWGSSADIDTRFCNHKSKLSKGNHENPYLQNSFNKHGGNNFIFTRIEGCEAEDLFITEQKFIDKDFGSGNCYNINPNADCGIDSKFAYNAWSIKSDKLYEPILQFDGDSVVGLYKNIIELTRATGYVASNIRLSIKSGNNRYGFKWVLGKNLPGVLEKELHIGYRNYLKKKTNKKPVVDVTTGIVYGSITEASKLSGISKKGIQLCVRGEYNQIKGSKFKYVEV